MLSLDAFPVDWKVVTVVPLHKGGGKKEIGSYCPIALLYVIRKKMKKIRHKRIYIDFWNHLSCLAIVKAAFDRI